MSRKRRAAWAVTLLVTREEGYLPLHLRTPTAETVTVTVVGPRRSDLARVAALAWARREWAAVDADDCLTTDADVLACRRVGDYQPMGSAS